MRPAVATAMFILALPGCSERAQQLRGELRERVRAEVVRQAHDQITVDEPISAHLTEDQQRAVKLSLYVDCLGSTVDAIRRSHQHYRAHLDDRGTPRRKGVAGIVPIEDPALIECRDAIEVGPTTKPELESIERLASHYNEAAAAYAEISRDLAGYYTRKTFETDRWAHGKAQAPRIAAAFDAWAEAHTALQRAVDIELDEIGKRQLEAHEHTAGQDLEFASRSLVLAVRAFARCIAPGDGGTCGEHLAQVQRHSQQVDALGSTSNVFWMGAFRERATDFADQAAEAMGAQNKGKIRAAQRERLLATATALERDFENVRFAGK